VNCIGRKAYQSSADSHSHLHRSFAPNAICPFPLLRNRWAIDGYSSIVGTESRLCKTERVPATPGKKPVAPPIVSFKEEIAGRETLEAIAEARIEVFYPLAHRLPASTQFYGAISPKSARALDDAPEVSVSFLPAGRATQAAIEVALGQDGPTIEVHEASLDEFSPELSEETTWISGLPIEEQHTFIVRTQYVRLREATAQKLLLKNRLLPSLPGKKMSDVTKVLVEAHGEDACLVRFWTKVGC
jgi:hypothetical protein